MTRGHFVLSSILLTLAVSGRALAWDEPALWWKSAHSKTPGGGGAFLPRCTSCHTDVKVGTDATLTVTPDWGKMGVTQTYKPGQRYEITAKLHNESLGQSGCAAGKSNTNGFGLRFVTANGFVPVGQLESDSGQSAAACPRDLPKVASGTTVLYRNCQFVVHRGEPAGVTEWKVFWTAPAPGTGPLVIQGGVVDGDCSASSLHDGVKDFGVYLGEATAALEVSGPRRYRLASVGFGLGVVAVVALPGSALLARRRRRR